MEHMINPRVLEIIPYQPGRPIEEIQREFKLKRVVKLASNENMFPIPQNVALAIRDELPLLHYYPDSDNYYLSQRIAEYNRIDIENILVGAGSVEIIRMIISAFLKPGEEVLSSEKSFSYYKIATTELAGKSAFIEAAMDDHLQFNLENIHRLIRQQTKIIFLTNPNNPTGTMLPKKRILDFIASVPKEKIVVLDNAYHEYVDDPTDYADGIREAVEGKNLIVLRTFSKVYGLAGLRVGYAISSPEIIATLNRVKSPFNVTRVGQRAALASLENDDYKNRSAALNRKNRAVVQKKLQQLGLKVIPSQTNFLLFFPEVDVAKLNLGLMQEGVIVRPTPAFGIPDAIRVTIGQEEDNRFFLTKLEKVLAELKSKP